MNEAKWLHWVREIRGLAQNGIGYAVNGFELERWRRVEELCSLITAEYSDLDFETLQALSKAELGYATPKVDVRGLCLQDGKILLVREKIDGGWTLPGGWADLNEPPSSATEREIREESGYESKAVRLLALYDRTDARHQHPPHLYYIFKAYFLCELTGGEASETLETSDVGFFTLQDLPPLSTGRTSEADLHRLYALAMDPAAPADFD